MEIEHDEHQGRFFIEKDGHLSILHYRMEEEGLIHFTSTFVPPAFRGRGYGAFLVKAGLDHAVERNYRVRSSCWFVDEVLERSPEYAELLKRR